MEIGLITIGIGIGLIISALYHSYVEVRNVNKNKRNGNLCDNCGHRGKYFDESINEWKCAKCDSVIV